MMHAGGMTWGSTTYDPELNLIYFGTGNPQPVINGRKRQGDNLFTESIVALNPDTGKMAWYFQSSPHDTHDWDATQTPVLFDGEIDGAAAQAAGAGEPQRLVLRARSHERPEHPQHASTSRRTGRRASTRRASRFPIRPRSRRPDGALVSPNQGGGQNWPPPSFSPRTGLFYANALARLQRVLPLRERGRREAAGLGRQRSRRLVRGDAAGDRLQDRQDRLEPQVDRQQRGSVGTC